MTNQRKDLKQLKKLLNKVASHKPKKAPNKAQLEKAYTLMVKRLWRLE